MVLTQNKDLVELDDTIAHLEPGFPLVALRCVLEKPSLLSVHVCQSDTLDLAAEFFIAVIVEAPDDLLVSLDGSLPQSGGFKIFRQNVFSQLFRPHCGCHE